MVRRYRCRLQGDGGVEPDADDVVISRPVAKRKKRFPWRDFLFWLIPSPLPMLPYVWSVVSNVVSEIANYEAVNRSVGDNFFMVTFESMNVSNGPVDCNRVVRLVTNTSLTPGAGQLWFNG